MPPAPILEFVNRLQTTKYQNRAFVYSTYTTAPLDSNYYVIDKLSEKGYCVTTQHNFKAPGASSFLYANPKLPVVKSRSVFAQDIRHQIEDFAKSILSKDIKASIPVKYHPLHEMNVFFSKLIFENLFYRKLKSNGNCVNCGKCTNSCPSSNLIIENGKLVIKDSNGCMHCLRCVMTCPQKAIDFTSSKRRGNYTQEIIEHEYSKKY